MTQLLHLNLKTNSLRKQGDIKVGLKYQCKIMNIIQHNQLNITMKLLINKLKNNHTNNIQYTVIIQKSHFKSNMYLNKTKKNNNMMDLYLKDK